MDGRMVGASILEHDTTARISDQQSYLGSLFTVRKATNKEFTHSRIKQQQRVPLIHCTLRVKMFPRRCFNKAPGQEQEQQILYRSIEYSNKPNIQNVSDVTICTNSDQNKHERPLIKKTESMNDQFQRTDQQPHGSAVHDYL